jgi:methyltransferase (TIGR00027 family)
MALFRAIESSRPQHQRLFEDLFAPGFLRPSLKLAWMLSRIPRAGKFVPRFIDQRWPGARTSGVARTRLIDDLLAQALERGVLQVVILGAGFDSRAYRLPHASAARFFEVDQPSTSRLKRRILQEHFGALPSHVIFLELDFNRQQIGPGLAVAGFQTGQPTFFLWEGVTNYLTAPAVDSTLRWFGSCGQGHELVFTYVDRQVIDNPASYQGTGALERTLARVGERWTFGLDPSEVRTYLAARGIELIEDLGAALYRSRYLGHPGDGYEFYRVVHARTGIA